MVLGERQVEVPWVIKQLNEYGGSCLDVGSAGGDYIWELKRQGRKLVRLDQLDIPPDGFSWIVKGDIRHTQHLITEKFGVVMLVSTLEHVGMDAYGFLRSESPIEEQVGAFEICWNYVEDGGVLIATIPFGRFEDGGWYLTYNRQMINMLINDKYVLKEDYYTLDKETWNYENVFQYMCPLDGQDWPRQDFSRATSICCIVLKKTDRKVYGHLLNLGCGAQILDGYMNVDLIGDNPMVIHQDIATYMQRCPSNSVMKIVMSHSLEHIHLPIVGQFMEDCFRSLAPGGWLEIVCPDSRWAMGEYLEGKMDYNTIQMYLHANQVNKYDFHRWVTDGYIIPKIASDVGFTDIAIYHDRGNVAVHCRKHT